MPVKSKFSHLGMSVLFYILFSFLLGVIAVSAFSIGYVFITVLKDMSDPNSYVNVLDPAYVLGLSKQISSNLTMINIINLIAVYILAVPVSILILNAPKYRDVPLSGFSFFTPEEKAQKRNLSPQEFLKFVLYTFPLGMGGLLLGNIVAILLSLISGKSLNDALTTTLTGMSLPVVFLSTVIIAPLFEEFLYRYAIIGYCRRFGEWNAIVISAFVFSLTHFNVTQFFYTFLLGLLFGYVFVYTRQIKYTFVLHALFNLYGAFLPLLITDNLSSTGTNFIIYQCAEYGLAVIGLIVLVLGFNKGEFSRLPEGGFSTDKIRKDSFLNPGMIVLIIFAIIYTAIMAFYPQAAL